MRPGVCEISQGDLCTGDLLWAGWRTDSVLLLLECKVQLMLTSDLYSVCVPSLCRLGFLCCNLPILSSGLGHSVYAVSRRLPRTM